MLERFSHEQTDQIRDVLLTRLDALEEQMTSASSPIEYRTCMEEADALKRALLLFPDPTNYGLAVLEVSSKLF